MSRVRRAVERALELGPGRVGVPEVRPVASRAEAQAALSPAPAEQPVSRSEMFRRALK